MISLRGSRVGSAIFVRQAGLKSSAPGPVWRQPSRLAVTSTVWRQRCRPPATLRPSSRPYSQIRLQRQGEGIGPARWSFANKGVGSASLPFG